ncbi:hypothetical protein [Actinoplanes sp. NBRC 103695]|jgi:hypothetical protein|uniref:hypothetical protein n=1 Tax=Actinoplanes sp. NBRC 103695 TaxID=3032202 RepID=UPI0024A01ECF|nr:hypothetical protein [Actinoplanes sp. NBRC 103695]GLZ01428.1 hypothetical protein Acsp02_86790 [Actinoplanes sp. NBRC 103695]
MDTKPVRRDPGFVPVIDVSRLSLAQLTRSNRPEMSRSLRQVINTLDDPNGVISAFQSFASER